MNHNEIVTSLEHLMPEITRTRDPRGVLLKYASEKNLAPAQMVRMANFFNIAKTLNFMKKEAGNRGGSFDLIDTVELEKAYSGGALLDKAASVRSMPAPAVVKQAGEKFEAHDRPDHLLLKAAHDMDIWAEEAPPPMPTRDNWRDHFAESSDARVKREIISGLRDECMDKLAAFYVAVEDASRRSVDFSAFAEIEEDVRCSSGEDGGLLMNKAAAYLESVRTPVRRWNGENSGVFQEDRHGLVKLAEEAVAALHGLQILDDDIEEFLGINKQAFKPDGGTKEDKKTGAKIPGVRDEEVSPPQMIQQVEQAAKPAIRSAIDLVTGGKGSDLSYATPIEKLVGNMPSSKGLLGMMPFPDKAKYNDAVDSSVRDAMMTTSLQRLMLTDPVISKQDPDAVISHFNTIANTNPAIAMDREMLRYVLREALEYDAVPISSFDTMLGMQDKQQKGVGGRFRNEQTVYQDKKPERENNDR